MEDFMPDENSQGGSLNQPDTNAELGNMVNAAVTAHLKRFAEKQLPDILKGHLDAALKPVVEKLTAPVAPPPSDDEPSPKTKGKNQPSPELAAMQQKLDDSLRALKEADDKRVAAEKKAREDRAYSDFKSELGKHVRPDMLDLVANHLFRIEGLVEVQEDGSALFKSSRSQYGIAEEIRLPLKDGVEQYVKSDAAKPFIPAPSTSQAPQTKKTPFQQPTKAPDAKDFDTMSPQQRVAAASRMEDDMRAKMAAAGRKI